MMRLAVRSVLFTLLVVITITAVNYAVDPANLFAASDYELGIADHLIRGEGLSGISDYDERLVQKFYAERLSRTPDVLVLGSSRSMQLDSKSFPGRAFFNASVSGPTLEDYIAIYGLYATSGRPPKLLIFNLDPWLVTRQLESDRWKSIYKDYIIGARRCGIVARYSARTNLYFKLRRYASLVSPNYFQSSLAAVLMGTRVGRYHVLKAGEVSDRAVRYPDGSYDYDRSVNEREASEVRMNAIRYAGQVPRYNVDTGVKESFELLMSTIKKDVGQVVIYLPPYNPTTYAGLSDGVKKSIDAIERYAVDFARAKGIRVVGSYNPALTGYTESDFIDGNHVRMRATARYLRSLKL